MLIARGLALCLPVVLLAGSAWAGAPTEAVRRFIGEVDHVLRDPATVERPDRRLAAVHLILRTAFDFEDAARTALGPEWEARTPAERAEFVRLFAGLLGSALAVQVGARARTDGGLGVRYLGEIVDNDRAGVLTAVATRSGDDMSVGYRMVSTGDRWVIHDVVIDGVSLAANYRAQVSRVLQGSSWEDLVGRMRARAAVAASSPPADRTAGTAIPAPPTKADGTVTMEITERIPALLPQRPLEPGAPAPRPTSAPPYLLHAGPAGVVGPWPGAGAAARLLEIRLAMLKTTTKFWVQVGAFKDRAAARRLASRLRQRPLVGAVVAVGATGHEGDLSRVRVGPFPDRARASSTLRDLKARGYPAFITTGR